VSVTSGNVAAGLARALLITIVLVFGTVKTGQQPVFVVNGSVLPGAVAVNTNGFVVVVGSARAGIHWVIL
jgi:hypothetical protein